MRKIDFYVLSDADPLARYRLACRIAEKAYSLGLKVHIHTDSKEDAQQLDALLWTFRDRSFVPHEIEPQTPDQYPVTIGHGWAPPHCEVLINLALQVPAFFQRFKRVAEIIGGEQEARGAARERYRFYRDRGCMLSHHVLTGYGQKECSLGAEQGKTTSRP
jgi:DNA polymerase-3 subunit chi